LTKLRWCQLAIALQLSLVKARVATNTGLAAEGEPCRRRALALVACYSVVKSTLLCCGCCCRVHGVLSLSLLLLLANSALCTPDLHAWNEELHAARAADLPLLQACAGWCQGVPALEKKEVGKTVESRTLCAHDQESTQIP
jgi:hypothetical protein